MKTLKQAHISYLEQVKGSIYEESLSTEQYECWSVPVLLNNAGKKLVINRHYVWVGNKGSLHVTGCRYPNKNDDADPGLVQTMKAQALNNRNKK